MDNFPFSQEAKVALAKDLSGWKLVENATEVTVAPFVATLVPKRGGTERQAEFIDGKWIMAPLDR